MKKMLLIFTILMFSGSSFAQDLFLGGIMPDNAQNTTKSVTMNKPSKQAKNIITGDSQELVLQKMGKPEMAGTLDDGTQVWVYTEVKKTNTAGTSVYGLPMSFGAGSFNAQIATNGFGGNIYTNQSPIHITEDIEDTTETTIIRVHFSQSGTVEKVTKETKVN